MLMEIVKYIFSKQQLTVLNVNDGVLISGREVHSTHLMTTKHVKYIICFIQLVLPS